MSTKLPRDFISLLDVSSNLELAKDFHATAHAGELPGILQLLHLHEYLVRVQQDNTINGVTYKHNPTKLDVGPSFTAKACARCVFIGNVSCRSIRCIAAERTDKLTGYFTKQEIES